MNPNIAATVKIAVVGAGSIGSNLILMLSRMGFSQITVYDADRVEDHNLGHQAYTLAHIGKAKAEALATLSMEATGTKIEAIARATDGIEIDTDILVLAVDNMKARKEIMSNAKYRFAVDGRMGGETFNVFAWFKPLQDRYEATLYSDSEAKEAPCGGKAIAYTSYLIAGIMGNTIAKYVNGGYFPFEQNFCTKNFIYSTTE